MVQKYTPGKQFGELLIGNYDLLERERDIPIQMSMNEMLGKSTPVEQILNERVTLCKNKSSSHISRHSFFGLERTLTCKHSKSSCGVTDYQLRAQQHVPIGQLRIQDFFHQQGTSLLPNLKSRLSNGGNRG